MVGRKIIVILSPESHVIHRGPETIYLNIQEQLKEAGWDAVYMKSMMETLEYLRSNPEAKSTALLVAPSISLLKPGEYYDVKTYKGPAIPADFHKGNKKYEGGSALINYVRKKNLINSDTPAYLAQQYPLKKDLPESVTKMIDLCSPLAEQLQPTHFRSSGSTTELTT